MNHLVGKTVKTRGGLDVKIIAYCPELREPIIGILNKEVEQWNEKGEFYAGSFHGQAGPVDLVLE